MPLERATRQDMERGLGLDLSGVRAHTSRAADRSARALSARAYTVGRHIVFGAGEYAPRTPDGRRLLRHELAHVQDSHVGPVRVLRQPAGAAVAAQAVDDQREVVNQAIHFLREGASFYSVRTVPRSDRPGEEPGGARVRLDQLGSQLAGLMRTRDAAANLIATALGGDAALTERLRIAYRDAVTALLEAAAREGRRGDPDAATGDSPYQLFQRHQQVIHEWAWPRATPDPQANVLLERVPEAERTQIRLADTSYDLPPAAIDSYFHPRARPVPPPANATIVIAPGGSVRVRAGLTRLAAMLVTTMQPPLAVNTTTTVALDLGRYGGDRALYRFTHVQHAAVQAAVGPREILVERLGSRAADQRPPPQQAVPADVFSRHGFVRASGRTGTSVNWPDDQFAQLQSATAQVPESILGSVKGLTFIRIAGANPEDPRAGAAYDIGGHAIKVYDTAFAGSGAPIFATPGGPASTSFDRLIAHEIGHAVDLAPLRQRSIPFESSVLQQRRFHTQPVPGKPGRVILPKSERAGWQALQDRLRRQQAALEQGRSLSGERYERDAAGRPARTEQLPKGEANDFRNAAAADGQIRITTYSDKAISEYFAEAFSLYISEPQTLAWLRPQIYEYFARRFPDAARPPAAPTATPPAPVP